VVKLKTLQQEQKLKENVRVTAYFYDSKRNNVGSGSYQRAVNPNILKSLKSAAFIFKATTSIMRGTQPSFLRLEYEAAA
jgi:hypothetical protein